MMSVLHLLCFPHICETGLKILLIGPDLFEIVVFKLYLIRQEYFHVDFTNCDEIRIELN